jgi:hypothetical protein
MIRLPWSKTTPAEPTQPTPLETIHAKLDANTAALQSAEGELQRVSLDAVLGEGQAAGFDAIGRLQALRIERELLANADNQRPAPAQPVA